MNEPTEITGHLLDFYKGMGTDPYNVVNDASFKGLPLAARIEALKAHAEAMRNSKVEGLSPVDKATIKKDFRNAALIGAALATQVAFARRPNGALLPKMEHLAYGAAGAALGGVGVAAVANVNRYLDVLSKRRALNAMVDNLAEKKDTRGALGVLSAASLMEAGSTASRFSPMQLIPKKYSEIDADDIRGRVSKQLESLEALEAAYKDN